MSITSELPGLSGKVENTTTIVKMSPLERYYNVVRSAHHVYGKGKSDMSFSAFTKMHRIDHSAIHFLLKKCVVRSNENGKKLYQWNVTVTPDISLAQSMLDKTRDYQKQQAILRKEKKKEMNNVKDTKQDLSHHYAKYKSLMGKPGYFARLASIIMKDVKEEKGLVISWDSGKELAREFVEFKSFDLDNLGNKTIKTKTKTKAKVAKASPVVGNQDYDIMLNKRINDNKNNLSMLNSQLQAKLNKADQLDKDMNKGRVKREFKSPKPDMVVIERIPPIKQFIMGTGFLYSLYLIDTLVNFYLTR